MEDHDEANEIAPKVLTRKQAAIALGLSVSTLDALTKNKKIAVCRAGRRKIYLPRHLEEYLAAIERPRAA